MIIFIKEIKNHSYFCGCEDFSDFGDPYYMTFGSQDDAIIYYCLEHALEDIAFIVKHDTYYSEEDFRLEIIGTSKELTVQNAWAIVNNS